MPLKIKCMRNFAAAYLTKVRATEVRIHSDARKDFDAVAPTHTEKLVDLSIWSVFALPNLGRVELLALLRVCTPIHVTCVIMLTVALVV